MPKKPYTLAIAAMLLLVGCEPVSTGTLYAPPPKQDFDAIAEQAVRDSGVNTADLAVLE